jgi:signal transduction histidine kinase
MTTLQHTRTASHSDETVLDALYEHIAIINLSGKIIFVNQAWKNFAQANAYPDPNYGLNENYFNTIKGTEIEAGIRSVLNGNLSHYSYEYPCHLPTEERWFWLYVTPLINHTTQIIGAITSHINMTQRKLAELQVEALQKQLLQTERNKVLIETAGAVAHEINQLLTAILGLSELLSKRTDLPTDIIDDLQLIFESSQRVHTIIQKMLKAETYIAKSYVGETNIVDFDASHEKHSKDE